MQQTILLFSLAGAMTVLGQVTVTAEELFGRLHPLVVHFPISLLLAAAGAELFAAMTRRAGWTSAARWCLWLGTLVYGEIVVTSRQFQYRQDTPPYTPVQDEKEH